MTGNYVQEGKNLNYTNTTEDTIAAGTLVIVGTIAAVATAEIEPGEVGAIATTGVFSFDKDAAAIEAGAKVYYDSTADNITATDTDNTYIGVCVSAAAASDTIALVRLNM